MENQNKPIQVRLISVSESQFMLNVDEQLLDKAEKQGGPKIGFGHSVHVDMAKSLITLYFIVAYRVETTTILESKCVFVFKISNIEDVVKAEKEKFQIKVLMPHFINVAIGTMRGIVAVKTAGTPLAKYPIPLLDANKVLNSMVANGIQKTSPK